MERPSRIIAPMWIAVVVAIGCGGSKPQDAAAKPPRADEPVQVAQAPAEVGPAAGGSAAIQGSVRFEGSAPGMEALKMDADPVCQQQHATPVTSEEVVVNANGTLKNVFVYVKEGVKGTFPAPTQPAVLDQSGCQYKPHVLGLQANQPLEIVNSDGTLHNINAKPASNQPFNVAQPIKGMKTKKAFAKPEVMVRFKCNVHPWMSAYAGVVAHPFFAVSDAEGVFSIAGLPAGTYVLEAWHEQYGTKTQTVSVKDGETKAVEFAFTGE